MRTTMLPVPSDESDLPLFDDVKKGESYLWRDIFCVFYFCLDMYFCYVLWTCIFSLCVSFLYVIVFGHPYL